MSQKTGQLQWYGALTRDGETADYVYWSWAVPTDFLSLISVDMMLIGAGTGDIIYSGASVGVVAADGQAEGTHVNSPGDDTVALVLDVLQTHDVKAWFDNLAAGDFCSGYLARNGAHASDTVNADVWVIGFRLKYIGRK